MTEVITDPMERIKDVLAYVETLAARGQAAQVDVDYNHGQDLPRIDSGAQMIVMNRRDFHTLMEATAP